MNFEHKFKNLRVNWKHFTSHLVKFFKPSTWTIG